MLLDPAILGSGVRLVFDAALAPKPRWRERLVCHGGVPGVTMPVLYARGRAALIADHHVDSATWSERCCGPPQGKVPSRPQIVLLDAMRGLSIALYARSSSLLRGQSAFRCESRTNSASKAKAHTHVRVERLAAVQQPSRHEVWLRVVEASQYALEYGVRIRNAGEQSHRGAKLQRVDAPH